MPVGPALGAFVVAFLLMLAAAPSGAQDRCRDILAAGVYEFTSTNLDEREVKSWSDWFAARYSDRSGSAESQRQTLSATYGAWGGDYNSDRAKNQYRDLTHSTEEYRAGFTERQKAVRAASQTISQAVVSEWSRCMQQVGFHASYSLTAVPQDYMIRFRYQPQIVGTPTPPISVTLEPSNNITCRTQALTIAETGDWTICSRSDDRPGYVAIRAPAVRSGTFVDRFDFPAVPRPKQVHRARYTTNELECPSLGPCTRRSVCRTAPAGWTFIPETARTVPALAVGGSHGIHTDRTDERTLCWYVEGPPGTRMLVSALSRCID